MSRRIAARRDNPSCAEADALDAQVPALRLQVRQQGAGHRSVHLIHRILQPPQFAHGGQTAFDVVQRILEPRQVARSHPGFLPTVHEQRCGPGSRIRVRVPGRVGVAAERLEERGPHLGGAARLEETGDEAALLRPLAREVVDRERPGLGAELLPGGPRQIPSSIRRG